MAEALGGRVVEPFDPDNVDFHVDRKLGGIDQLYGVNGWTEFERAT